MHQEETIRSGAGFRYRERQSTDDIVDSLRPGAEHPLVVDDQGTVWDGNRRAFILHQRGHDVDSLPRTPKPPPVPEDFDDFD